MFEPVAQLAMRQKTTQQSHFCVANDAPDYNLGLYFDTVRELRDDICEMWPDYNFQQRLGSVRKLITMFADDVRKVT